jgi:hypothetical protein
MKNKDDNNPTSTPDVTLTPFEIHAKNSLINAEKTRIMHETNAIIQKLDELNALFDGEDEALDDVYWTLKKVADGALIGLASELEEMFGISA